MAKNKLRKFSEIAELSNVYQNFDATKPTLVGAGHTPVEIKGKWRSEHFKNENPIVLELACGGGEYTVAMARMYPNKNFIGVDIKGARIWKGATKATEENLSNAAFLRIRIEQIGFFFEEGEVDEIWITFPDPFLKEGKHRRRLTSAPFLNRYKPILKENSIINLKTDSTELYEFTLETIAEEGHHLLYSDDDIYAKELPLKELAVKTYYESIHLAKGKTIKFLQVKLKG